MVIDDAVLLDVLTGLSKNDILAGLQGDDLFRTGCWYYRLSRAVHSDQVGGSLHANLPVSTSTVRFESWPHSTVSRIRSDSSACVTSSP